MGSVVVEGRTDNRNVKIESDGRHITIEAMEFDKYETKVKQVRLPVESVPNLAALVKAVCQEAVQVSQGATILEG